MKIFSQLKKLFVICVIFTAVFVLPNQLNANIPDGIWGDLVSCEIDIVKIDGSKIRGILINADQNSIIIESAGGVQTRICKAEIASLTVLQQANVSTNITGTYHSNYSTNAAATYQQQSSPPNVQQQNMQQSYQYNTNQSAGMQQNPYPFSNQAPPPQYNQNVQQPTPAGENPFAQQSFQDPMGLAIYERARKLQVPAILLNTLVFPGLGSVIQGDRKSASLLATAEIFGWTFTLLGGIVLLREPMDESGSSSSIETNRAVLYLSIGATILLIDRIVGIFVPISYTKRIGNRFGISPQNKISMQPMIKRKFVSATFNTNAAASVDNIYGLRIQLRY